MSERPLGTGPTPPGTARSASAVTATRRAVLGGSAAAAVTVAVPASATAAYLPRTRAYTKTPLPRRRDLHVLQRFTFGYTPALRRQVAAAGGIAAWFEKQLRPGLIDDTLADSFAAWFPRLTEPAPVAFDNVRSKRVNRSEYVTGMQQHALLRRVYSNRQVHEVMTDFWLNHFHVYIAAHPAFPFRPSYDATIRAHALGSFEDLLKAAVTHPAMLRYLDADESTADDLNENLGRELLELHTVGRDAGYSEADVRTSAKILTGQLVDEDTLVPYYRESAHHHGWVSLLGFTHDNAWGQEREVLDAYLTYLARHESTARRLARKLAIRFVSDDPPAALVDRVAEAYLASGTRIKDTLRALLDDPEFYSAATPKVRTPADDVVATLRAVGARIHGPLTGASDEAARAILWLTANIGQKPWSWVTPDGLPDRDDAWASASRMLASFRVHHTLAGGYYPSKRISYTLKDEWLPQRRIRFDELVDHLCRTLHGRRSTRAILGAACGYLDVTPGTVITASHVVCRYRMPLLISLLLDAPAHMTR